MVLPWESEFPSPSGKRRTSVVVVLLLCSAMLQMWIGISPSAFAFMGCSIDALLLPKENSAAADAIASPPAAAALLFKRNALLQTQSMVTK